MNIGYYNEVQLKFIIKMQKKNSSTSGGLRPQTLNRGFDPRPYWGTSVPRLSLAHFSFFLDAPLLMTVTCQLQNSVMQQVTEKHPSRTTKCKFVEECVQTHLCNQLSVYLHQP